MDLRTYLAAGNILKPADRGFDSRLSPLLSLTPFFPMNSPGQNCVITCASFSALKNSYITNDLFVAMPPWHAWRPGRHNGR